MLLLLLSLWPLLLVVARCHSLSRVGAVVACYRLLLLVVVVICLFVVAVVPVNVTC